MTIIIIVVLIVLYAVIEVALDGQPRMTPDLDDYLRMEYPHDYRTKEGGVSIL